MQPRRFTIDDYYKLPDEIRTELIDGVFYDLAAPTVNHQIVILAIASQFYSCMTKHENIGRVLMAPCDVQLDKDRFTMVQPDVLVVCDPAKLRKRVCYGAPDLIVEVMSPLSCSHDAIRKLNKYREAGVREYWLVDPDDQRVMVYRFEEENSFRVYSFRDRVPVGISGGKCEIDFVEVASVMVEPVEEASDGGDKGKQRYGHGENAKDGTSVTHGAK